MTVSNHIGVVILAAGSSSRLGQPKQLLQYQNKSLLQRVIDMIAPFNFASSVLVLGAYADQIGEATDLKDITAVYNEHWTEGIASSIRLGVVKSIKLNASLDSLLFLLSDQPYVSSELIRELINTHQENENHHITACTYKQNIGVPAIFPKCFFPKLQELTGDVGAKKIMMQHSEEVDEVAFKEGDFDIDTTEDYEQLRDRDNVL